MARPPAFLFLQGPPGPLFRRLAEQMRANGFPVHRINLNGGDWLDWHDGAVDFRGRFSEWPVFLDNFLREKGITDLLLFGDCRPYHLCAHGIAAARKVRTHVLEEGYIRPDWMTLEPEGVNARSTLCFSEPSAIGDISMICPMAAAPALVPPMTHPCCL